MDAELLIPICALLMPVAIVPSVLAYKHLARRRELLHTERMRAIDLGQDLGPPVSAFWPSMAAIAVGAGVPFFAFLFAYLTILRSPDASEVWACATAVGLAGVIGGSVLGTKLLTVSAGVARREAVASRNGKPSYEPDVYDTVGPRG